MWQLPGRNARWRLDMPAAIRPFAEPVLPVFF